MEYGDWVRTTDRLPPDDLEVLGWWPNGEMDVVLYYEGHWDSRGEAFKPPAFWTLLPKRPTNAEVK